MSRYIATCHATLGRWTDKRTSVDGALQMRLVKADVPVVASQWLAAVIVTSMLVGSGVAILAVPLTVLAGLGLLGVPVALLAGLFAAGVSAGMSEVYLANAASERAKEIDENLPHALNHMLALAGAGIPPREIWASIAKQKVYGPLAREAGAVQRDISLLGIDIVTAMRNAQERAPSGRLREFLQGAVSAFQSGVDLDTYLRQKSKQYAREEFAEQERRIDSVGVLAESFLVVVVAAPLFMMILLTVFAVSQGGSVLVFGYLLAFLFVPLSQTIIGAMVRSLNPKVAV